MTRLYLKIIRIVFEKTRERSKKEFKKETD